VDIFEETADFFRAVKTEKRVIGLSVLGREIFAVRMGEGRPTGIVQYAIHGREWIVARLAFEHYRIGGVTGSVWLIPLMDPDGALLSQTGISSVKEKALAERLIEINGGNDFSLWKANGVGVDLNVNFDADWGKGKYNARAPAPENYIGAHPFSEPETQALKRFTEEINPDLTVSYHTKGEEIYWYYHQSLSACARDKKLAAVLSAATGYPLAQAHGSAGGYKDWCIRKLGIPSFTVEAGRESFPHPLGEEAFEDIKEHNRYALCALTRAVAER
jgi:g-D-glutamyl-meso-diaminopimelate peptidase